MASVTFVQPDGASMTVEIRNGLSVMEGAVANQVPGILAECGGSCSCSTCHCYVEPDWTARLPEPGGDESGLLEFAWEPKENSRLTCQIEVTDDIDGLILHVPAQQL